jgi:hypothetical protein
VYAAMLGQLVDSATDARRKGELAGDHPVAVDVAGYTGTFRVAV